MGRLNLDELRVYRMAEEMADCVWEVVRNWKHFERNTVGDQLVRAADSVGANIAEGYGRASPLDHQRFVRTARGSLYEVRFFLRRSHKRGLLPPTEIKKLQDLLGQLLPALNSYLTALIRASRKSGG